MQVNGVCSLSTPIPVAKMTAVFRGGGTCGDNVGEVIRGREF